VNCSNPADAATSQAASSSLSSKNHGLPDRSVPRRSKPRIAASLEQPRSAFAFATTSHLQVAGTPDSRPPKTAMDPVRSRATKRLMTEFSAPAGCSSATNDAPTSTTPCPRAAAASSLPPSQELNLK
jgi:hypothetical protein